MFRVSLSIALMVLSFYSIKAQSLNKIGDSIIFAPQLFDARVIGWFLDTAGTATHHTLSSSKLDTVVKDHLKSFINWGKSPNLWLALLVINNTEKGLPITLHTGNIEFCSIYGTRYSGRPLQYGGFLRNPLKSPEVPLFLGPQAKDTIFLSVENYVISPKNIKIFIAETDKITTQKYTFREQKYIWWFIFQAGFAIAFFMAFINAILNWVTLKRIEYIYYALYLIVSILLFGALTMEAWILSFGSTISPELPTFSIFYLKVFFILYSFFYFRFFENYLDIKKDDKELSEYGRVLKIVQFGAIVIEFIIIFATNINIGIKFIAFAFLGAFLTVLASGYTLILIKKKSDLLKRPEVKLLNIAAINMNIILIPVTIWEMIWGGSIIGPVGFFFMQAGFLIESVIFNWTGTRKTLRLERDMLESEKERLILQGKALELENERIVLQNKALENEKELYNIREELTHDFHDQMGGRISKSIHYINEIIKKDKGRLIMEELQHLHKNINMIYDDYRELLELQNPQNARLDVLIGKIRDRGNFLFDQSGTALIIDFRPLLMPQIGIPMKTYKNLYLMVKEFLTNAFKHAQAKNITLRFYFEAETNRFEIAIEDDGKGFDLSQVRKGHGLGDFKERVGKENWVLNFDTVLGQGTKIQIMGVLGM